jgi:hypothetical protein
VKKSRILLMSIVLAVILQVIIVTANAAEAQVIVGNSKASVDVTNISDGNIKIAYKGGGTAKIKVIIISPNDKQYTFDLKTNSDYGIYRQQQKLFYGILLLRLKTKKEVYNYASNLKAR